MASQKKKAVPRVGKLPPQYRFFLNTYPDVRFTRCPQCNQPTRQRKLPLVIHVDPDHLLSLNKTCRYCPRCDLLIAHQNDLERLLETIFSDRDPEEVRNHYFVAGTLEKPAWKRGTHNALTSSEMFEAMHDFQEAVLFHLIGGWEADAAQYLEKQKQRKDSDISAPPSTSSPKL